MPTMDMRDHMNQPAPHKFDRFMRVINKFDFLSTLKFVVEEIGTAGFQVPNYTNLAASAMVNVCDKVDANSFLHQDGALAVGMAVSAFNHDDQPEALVCSLSLATEDMTLSPRMLYVLACTAVQPGQEPIQRR